MIAPDRGIRITTFPNHVFQVHCGFLAIVVPQGTDCVSGMAQFVKSEYPLIDASGSIAGLHQPNRQLARIG